METLYIFSTYNKKLLLSTDDIIAGKEFFSLINKYIKNIDYVILRGMSFDTWITDFNICK